MADILISNRDALKRVKRNIANSLEAVEEVLEKYPEEEENVEKVIKSIEMFTEEYGAPDGMADRIAELSESLHHWYLLIIDEETLWDRISKEGETKEKLDGILQAIYNLGRAYELASVINWGEFKKK